MDDFTSRITQPTVSNHITTVAEELNKLLLTKLSDRDGNVEVDYCMVAFGVIFIHNVDPFCRFLAHPAARVTD